MAMVKSGQNFEGPMRAGLKGCQLCSPPFPLSLLRPPPPPPCHVRTDMGTTFLCGSSIHESEQLSDDSSLVLVLSITAGAQGIDLI